MAHCQLPSKPHQPSSSFKFPTRTYGKIVLCPDPTHKGGGGGSVVTQAQVLGLVEALKPCNCKCKIANWKINLIIIPSHGRTMLLAKSCIHCTMAIQLDRFEVETVYKLELLQALQWCLEVLRWLCESCFQMYTAWWRLLVQYVYKRDFQLLQKVLKAHSTH